MNITLLGLSVLVVSLLVSVLPAHAQPTALQAGSAMDLINAVNAYRTSIDLAPYDIDGGLMSLAQGQSEYQASILTCTHQRGDGSGPGDHGISAENIACGANLSVQGAVYDQWADSLHLATMLGPTTGLVGAGVAVSGSQVYYTLAVKRLTGDFVYSPPQNNNQNVPVSNPQAQPQYQESFITNTPNSDGSISHIVRYGETLVGIAEMYGVPMIDIIGINRLDPKNPLIYERQALLIRLAFTATPFMTATYTPRPATRTPMPSRTPRPTRTITVFNTPVPTRTATSTPFFRVPTLEELGPGRSIMAYAFISISVIGLLVLLFTSFGRRSE